EKVFRPRKLPVLKNVLVYLLIALGSVMLWIFQIDADLPVVQSLLIAIVLIGLYRRRKWLPERRGPGRRPEDEGQGKTAPWPWKTRFSTGCKSGSPPTAGRTTGLRRRRRTFFCRCCGTPTASRTSGWNRRATT